MRSDRRDTEPPMHSMPDARQDLGRDRYRDRCEDDNYKPRATRYRGDDDDFQRRPRCLIQILRS